MDRLSPERRSWLMSRVKSRDTTPERIVRSIIYAEGYRYRIHRCDGRFGLSSGQDFWLALFYRESTGRRI